MLPGSRLCAVRSRLASTKVPAASQDGDKKPDADPNAPIKFSTSKAYRHEEKFRPKKHQVPWFQPWIILVSRDLSSHLGSMVTWSCVCLL